MYDIRSRREKKLNQLFGQFRIPAKLDQICGSFSCAVLNALDEGCDGLSHSVIRISQAIACEYSR